MGRAIDMEKDVDSIKLRLDRIEGALSRVIGVVGAMEEKAQQVKHVDLVEDVPSEDDWDPNEIGVEATQMMKEGAEKHVKEKAKKKKSGEKAKQSKKD
jgi:hypothetical protein